MKIELESVLLKPIVTEKSTRLREDSCYTFHVRKDTNKVTIKKAIEKIFNVTVVSCKISIVKPKKHMLRTRRGYGSSTGF